MKIVEQFQEYIIMRARRKSQRKDRPKTTEKRGGRKPQSNLSINHGQEASLPQALRQQLGPFYREEVPQSSRQGEKYQDPDRRSSRSQQSSRRSEKHELNLVFSNWMEPLRTGRERMGRGQFTLQHVMGKGGFGKVWKVEEKKSGQLFALKQMSKAVVMAKKSLDSVSNERELLSKVKSKFIVSMRQAFQDRENLYLLMDLMTGGDLRYHICRKHCFTEPESRFFTACIFAGLDYLHSHEIVHRDIKPENLVLDYRGYIHLTDLGIAKRLRPENSSDTSGTPGYMAPEVMCRQNHSYEVDFYALGIILYELMMGRRPYKGKSRKEIREQILARQVSIRKVDIPDGWSVEAADFINKLVQRKPMMRLGWGGSYEVKNHPWLRDFPWDDLENGLIDSPFKQHAVYNPNSIRYQLTKENEEFDGLVKENQILLRKSSVQKLFEGYTYVEEGKEMEHHTTSSELHRRREAEE